MCFALDNSRKNHRKCSGFEFYWLRTELWKSFPWMTLRYCMTFRGCLPNRIFFQYKYCLVRYPRFASKFASAKRNMTKVQECLSSQSFPYLPGLHLSPKSAGNIDDERKLPTLKNLKTYWKRLGKLEKFSMTKKMPMNTGKAFLIALQINMLPREGNKLLIKKYISWLKNGERL